MNTFAFFKLVAFFAPVVVHCRVHHLSGMYYPLLHIITFAGRKHHFARDVQACTKEKIFFSIWRLNGYSLSFRSQIHHLQRKSARLTKPCRSMPCTLSKPVACKFESLTIYWLLPAKNWYKFTPWTSWTVTKYLGAASRDRGSQSVWGRWCVCDV